MECSRQLDADKGKLLFHPRLMNLSLATHFTAMYNLLDPHHRRPLLLIFSFFLRCTSVFVLNARLVFQVVGRGRWLTERFHNLLLSLSAHNN